LSKEKDAGLEGRLIAHGQRGELLNRGQEAGFGFDKRDFHRVWDIRVFMHLDGDDQSSPAGGLIQVRAQLQQEQPGGFGLLSALGDLGITSNLL